MGLPPLEWMRSSQEARANGKPCARSQSMIWFRSARPCAAMAPIHWARSCPLRALSSARNSRSSCRSSPAMAECSLVLEPAPRARLVVKIGLAEARLQMPLLGQDGKSQDGQREERGDDRKPDVARDLRQAEEYQHLSHVDGIA